MLQSECTSANATSSLTQGSPQTSLRAIWGAPGTLPTLLVSWLVPGALSARLSKHIKNHCFFTIFTSYPPKHYRVNAIRAFAPPDPFLDPFKGAYLTTFFTNFAPGFPSGSFWCFLIFILGPPGPLLNFLGPLGLPQSSPWGPTWSFFWGPPWGPKAHKTIPGDVGGAESNAGVLAARQQGPRSSPGGRGPQNRARGRRGAGSPEPLGHREGTAPATALWWVLAGFCLN